MLNFSKDNYRFRKDMKMNLYIANIVLVII